MALLMRVEASQARVEHNQAIMDARLRKIEKRIDTDYEPLDKEVGDDEGDEEVDGDEEGEKDDDDDDGMEP